MHEDEVECIWISHRRRVAALYIVSVCAASEIVGPSVWFIRMWVARLFILKPRVKFSVTQSNLFCATRAVFNDFIKYFTFCFHEVNFALLRICRSVCQSVRPWQTGTAVLDARYDGSRLGYLAATALREYTKGILLAPWTYSLYLRNICKSRCILCGSHGMAARDQL